MKRSLEIEGKGCIIIIEEANFKLEGNYIAKILPQSLSPHCWPRWYFDKDLAVLEIISWLVANDRFKDESKFKERSEKE